MDPNLTSGGSPIFREDEVNTIGDMIQKWERMEKEEGGGEQKKEGRRSSGRRVSELSKRFEVRGDLINEGVTTSINLEGAECVTRAIKKAKIPFHSIRMETSRP